MAGLITIDMLAQRLIEAPGPLMGLDLGTKTIGIAVTDATGRLAVPVTTIRRTKFTPDVAAVLKLAAERAAVALVLGLPLNMDGTEGPRAQSTHSFARHLTPLTPLPILLWDERLSTVEADDILVRAGVPARRRAEMIDAAAAAVILEDVLARMAATGA